MKANSADLDQTRRFAASDLGMYCLPMPHKKGAMLIWVYYTTVYVVFITSFRSFGGIFIY